MSTKIEWTKNVDGSQGKSWNPIRARRKSTQSENNGLVAAESLLTWQTGGAGWRLTQHRIDSAKRGLEQYKLVAEELRKRPYRPEPEHYESPTSCQCSATSHPPCSFCEPSMKALTDKHPDCEICGDLGFVRDAGEQVHPCPGCNPDSQDAEQHAFVIANLDFPDYCRSCGHHRNQH